MYTYTYEVEGTAAGAHTFKCAGQVEGAPDDFAKCLYSAMLASFQKLARGEAGSGVVCRGPYEITRFELKLRPL